MTEPKQFKRGRRTYTRMGSFREVKIEGSKGAPAPAAAPVPMDIDAALEQGVYSNQATIYNSTDEVVLDFGFVAAAAPRGRVRSRVVISHKHAKMLSQLLKKAAEETV